MEKCILKDVRISSAVTAVIAQAIFVFDVRVSWCFPTLQVGDPFVLNCLGEAKYGVLMKVSCHSDSFQDFHDSCPVVQVLSFV